MTCRKAKKWLVFYREGELAVEQYRQLQAHIAQCNYCRQEYEDYQQQGHCLQRLKQTPALEHPEPFTNAILFSIRRQRSTTRRSPFERLLDASSRTSMRIAVASAIVLLVGLFVVQEVYILQRLHRLEQRLAQQPEPNGTGVLRMTEQYQQLLDELAGQNETLVVDKKMLQEWLDSYNQLEMSHNMLLKLLLEKENLGISLDNGLTAAELRRLLENKSLLKRIREL